MKKKLVVLTGAGISAESGLRTFRDSDGLWEGYEVTEVATPRAWKKNPALVLDFYNKRRQDVSAALPNAAHFGLASLEEWLDVTVITQNIDDLHERAGSTNVVHLHGSIFQMRSELDEDNLYEIRTDMKVGEKATDGSYLRPAIVWFEEPVPMIGVAADLVADADLFAIVGTSLVVYPAAGLINQTRSGIPLYIVDKKLPSVRLQNLVQIEKPATEGIEELTLLIKKEIGL
ncbi:MAG: Sir2 family NAD-dependent protein deacetylase [Chitinophagaceae bacterium]